MSARWSEWIQGTWPSEAPPLRPGEIVWVNNRYQVLMREIGRETAEDGVVVMYSLSIKRRDKAPIREWREFQRIKNELVGEEAEAVELFPAESRLMDTANQYWLWAITGAHFGVGFEGRLVSEAESNGSRQQPWPGDAKPADLVPRAEMDARVSAWAAVQKGRP